MRVQRVGAFHLITQLLMWGAQAIIPQCNFFIQFMMKL